MEIKTTKITSPQSEWPSLKSLQTTDAGEGMGERGLCHIVSGNVVGAATMENNTEDPQNTVLPRGSATPLLAPIWRKCQFPKIHAPQWS